MSIKANNILWDARMCIALEQAWEVRQKEEECQPQIPPEPVSHFSESC